MRTLALSKLARAPARLMQWPVARILAGLACVMAPVALLAPVTRYYATGPAMRVLFACVSVLLILASYAAYVRAVEKRSPRELSLRGAPGEIAVGVGIGMAVFSLTIAILAGVGAYRVTGINPASVMLATIPAYVVGAVFEEILFRAVIFRILEQSVGSWIALGISALLFGMMHFGSPGSGFLGALAIAVEAGVMLAAAYMLTRRIWLCVAIHFAWNFVQGGIFSVAVSGHAQEGLFQSQLRGADWLTGGQFGPEFSVVAVVLCSILGGLMLMRCIKSSNIILPYWRRNGA